jgi:hypothetical protein
MLLFAVGYVIPPLALDRVQGRLVDQRPFGLARRLNA